MKHHKPYIFINHKEHDYILPLECHDFSYFVYKLTYVKPQTLISTLAKDSALVALFSKGTYFLRVEGKVHHLDLLEHLSCQGGICSPYFIIVLQYIAHHTGSIITNTSFKELVVIT